MADPVEIDIRLRDEGTDCSRPKEGIRPRQRLVQNSSTVSSVSFALAIPRTRLTRPEWEHLQCPKCANDLLPLLKIATPKMRYHCAQPRTSDEPSSTLSALSACEWFRHSSLFVYLHLAVIKL